MALNRAVALAELAGPAAALPLIEALADNRRLLRSHLLPATRADLLRRLGRVEEARAAYEAALALAPTGAERRYLERRLADLA